MREVIGFSILLAGITIWGLVGAGSQGRRPPRPVSPVMDGACRWAQDPLVSGGAVCVPAPFASALPPATADKALALGQRLDINHTTESELTAVPGLGPSTAREIVRFRERQPFATLEALANVHGVGPGRIAAWRPYLECSEESKQ